MHWQCSLCQGSAFYRHYLAISMYTWKCFLLSLLVPFHSQFLFFSISHNYTKKQTFWVFFSLRLLSWTRSEPLICIDLCWGTTCLINNQLQLIFIISFELDLCILEKIGWQIISPIWTLLAITNFLCCRSLLFFLFKKAKSMHFFSAIC